MTYRGHIRNGQILLDEPVTLPEGAVVHVEMPTVRGRVFRPQRRAPVERFEPLRMPGGSLADELVSDRR